MSPPQAQFIDLSIRAPETPTGASEAPRAEIAAKVPVTSTDLYGRTARALRLHSLPKPVPIDLESERWFSFLDTLKTRADVGTVTSAQRNTLLSVWERAQGRQPSLRRPAVGISVDGLIQASWSFDTLPGRVFTMDIYPDGRVDWFYREPIAGVVLGSDDETTAELPEAALQLLVDGFGRSDFGTR